VNSLTERLHIGLGLSLVLLMGLIGWLIHDQNQRMIDDLVVSRLEHDGEGILAALRFDAEGNAILAEGSLAAIYHQPLSGHYFLVLTENGVVLRSRSLWDVELNGEKLATGEQRVRRITGPSEQPLVLWASGYNKGHHAVTIMVAEDISRLQILLLEDAIFLLVLTAIFLFVILFIQRRIVCRSFAPLRQLGREIKQLERGDIDQLTEAVPLEVRPLVVEVNRLLAVMSRRLDRSRNATGNLAHALKGPLNLLTQLAGSEEVQALPELKLELKKYSGQLTQLIDHELKRARLAGSGGAAQRFEAANELPSLIELLKRIYSNKSINIEASYPQTAIQNLDRNDMMELLGNLLDNASKWAEHKIICRIVAGDFISITVEDDGPGVTEEQLEKLTQRGSRVDESQPGHGLGLSIVNEIVELYQGSLQLDHSEELGGLRVTVQLKQTTAEQHN